MFGGRFDDIVFHIDDESMYFPSCSTFSLIRLKRNKLVLEEPMNFTVCFFYRCAGPHFFGPRRWFLWM